MKIAYLYELFDHSSVGVLKKIESQKAALQKLNENTIDILIFNTELESDDGRVRYIIYAFSGFPFLRNILLLFAKFWLLRKSYDLDRYDVILLRYPGADITGAGFMRKSKKVFIEIHAILSEEFKSKIAGTNSYLLKIVRTVRYFQERLFRKRMFKNCAGIITMSNEISNEILTSLHLNIPAKIISNGIDLDIIPHTGFSAFDGKTLKILFIGSRPESWHGIERLVRSVRKFNEVEIEIHFIGNITHKNMGLSVLPSDTIYFHGVLFGEELDKVISTMNIGICQLALYKKKMQELSTLKAVEYTARGIPFLLAYNDPNLYNYKKEPKFYLEFPNDNSDIDFKKVLEFMQQMNENRSTIISNMKEYSHEYLSWDLKMKQYIGFINNFYAE